MAKKHYAEQDAGSAASKFGQMIGETFEPLAVALIKDYIEQTYREYELLKPKRGRKKVTLEMFGGLLRQMDVVVTPSYSDDPVALLETKWLEDARHHNDKGAWILQLREVRKRYLTIRGVAAIFAGHWTEGVRLMLMGEGGIKMVLVATDEEIYSTLQQPFDEYLGENSFALDVRTMRKSYPQPWVLANLLIHLEATGQLDRLALGWFNFVRDRDADDNPLTGADLIKKAVNELLSPLPQTPRVQSFEITLQIDTGNMISQKFEDVESALEFIQTHFENPQAILEQITPEKRNNA